MVPKEIESHILRLFHVEKWPPGTIANQLRIHHEVVRRVLSQDGVPRARIVRPSKTDAYLPFILETWKKFPRLPASRLFQMCRERGYQGSPHHFRHRMARYRPRPHAEAYLRLRTLPGEQGQVDWAHFGTLQIGGAKRKLLAFVVVLSWSRALFLRFYFGQRLENFLRGHEAAFEFFGGVPRCLLYDNLKSAVLTRSGELIAYNPKLLRFAGHYRFEPRPVAVARGNEKGRVERAISYIRTGFFMGRSFETLEQLNEQAEAWCRAEALDRPCPEDQNMTVGVAFEREQGSLGSLPDNPFPTQERVELRVGKTPYVRYDLNDYSVPHTLVRQLVSVIASLEEVWIVHGGREVARHQRSFDKRQQIENPEHIAELVLAKRHARKDRALDLLILAAPRSKDFLMRLAEQGRNLGQAVFRLRALLESHGAAELEIAIEEALGNEAPHVEGVKQVLERRRFERDRFPIQPIPLPDDPQLRDLHVRAHSLSSYDTLGDIEDEENLDEQERPRATPHESKSGEGHVGKE